MKIDREKFLMLSLSMSMSLGCKKPGTTAAVQKAQNDKTVSAVDSSDEVLSPVLETSGGLAPDLKSIEMNGRTLNYDPESQCYVLIGSGEQNTCYDPQIECNQTDEDGNCTDSELQFMDEANSPTSIWPSFVPVKASDRCSRWNSTAECIEFDGNNGISDGESYERSWETRWSDFNGYLQGECSLWAIETICIESCEEYSPENECLVINVDPVLGGGPGHSSTNLDATWECIEFKAKECVRYRSPNKSK